MPIPESALQSPTQTLSPIAHFPHLTLECNPLLLLADPCYLVTTSPIFMPYHRMVLSSHGT